MRTCAVGLCCFGLALFSPHDLPAAEKWEDASGLFSTEADFVRIDGDFVVLRHTDGREVRVRLARLTTASQAKAKKLARTKGLSAGPLGAASMQIDPKLRIEFFQVTEGKPATSPIRLTYAAFGGPYVASGGVIYHIPTGEMAGSAYRAIIVDKNTRTHVSTDEEDSRLSSDGAYYAWSIRQNDGFHIKVIDTFDGSLSASFRVSDNVSVDTTWWDFIGDREIAWLGPVGFGSEQVCRILNVVEGTETRSFPLKLRSRDAFGTLRPDRKTLAIYDAKSIGFCDLDTGAVVGAINMPRRPSSMAFSPDGQELAMLVYDKCPLLVVLDKAGKPIFLRALPGIVLPQRTRAEYLQWLPDGRGWLVAYKYLIDRESKQLVWEVEPQTQAQPAVRMVGRDTALAFQDGFIVPQQVPWKKIAAALAASEKDEEAIIKPGMKVKLELALPPTSRQGPEFKAAATTACTNRGLTPAADGPLTIKIDCDPEREGAIEVLGADGRELWKRIVPAYDEKKFYEPTNLVHEIELPVYMTKEGSVELPVRATLTKEAADAAASVDGGSGLFD